MQIYENIDDISTSVVYNLSYENLQQGGCSSYSASTLEANRIVSLN